ncbi:hypothetical protein X773_33110 [Mesorhizobium sp. LSJC285A00]|uniref:hypothetical protein n=1 Tax=Mesorhizobium sp. LSJC285A00 TaxID=1287338 RepID=UPI0003CDE3A1|nr:hypothetical protein [Mesorhizobium sp. LSJC285A00]ESW64087.1 hypothetical protein X773_33110 [Mesorhizobium sp. LSJC285A00]
MDALIPAKAGPIRSPVPMRRFGWRPTAKAPWTTYASTRSRLYAKPHDQHHGRPILQNLTHTTEIRRMGGRSNFDASMDVTRVTIGKSRVREIRTPDP